MPTDRPLVKVVIAVPNEGLTQWQAYDNRCLMMIHLGVLQEKSKHEPVTADGAIFEFGHFTAGRMLTPVAREALADSAVRGEMDYMLMIDDDMITPIDLFERLYEHHVDIVAPLAFTRNAPHLPVMYKSETGWDSVARQRYFQNAFVRNYPKDTLVRCDAVGFGAVLINMKVIRAMQKPYFMSTCGTGEDIYFCYRAQQQTGAKVYMDTATKLGHLGHPVTITEEYAEHFWRDYEKRDVKKDYTEMAKYPVNGDSPEQVLA